MTEFIWPSTGGVRGPRFWANPLNWLASRKKFRRDHTVEWRQRYENDVPSLPDRSADFRLLTQQENLDHGFSFVILGDTGEGDRSQYALLPLIRALKPHFMIINGDLAYPAGREQDFVEGFFQPYRNLGIPIWAVPGNHEYYSPHNGREFFEIFCTPKQQHLWQDHGLAFVQQPGTYWELSSDDCPLVVLAVDSGMTAGLDPKQGLLGRSDGDSAQLAWLERRLARAQALRKKALLLFHIPALVNLKKASHPRLERLHGLLARYAATVSAVITAHEHSFQYYLPNEFARFVSTSMPAGPAYFVSGSGGAFLSPADYEFRANASGLFQADFVFPDRQQWIKYAGAARRVTNSLGLGRSWFGRVGNSLSAVLADSDPAKFQSLLHVEVRPGGGPATMTAYLQESLQQLYQSQPKATVVVAEGQPAPLPADLQRLTLKDPQQPNSTLTVQLA